VDVLKQVNPEVTWRSGTGRDGYGRLLKFLTFHYKFTWILTWDFFNVPALFFTTDLLVFMSRIYLFSNHGFTSFHITDLLFSYHWFTFFIPLIYFFHTTDLLLFISRIYLFSYHWFTYLFSHHGFTYFHLTYLLVFISRIYLFSYDKFSCFHMTNFLVFIWQIYLFSYDKFTCFHMTNLLVFIWQIYLFSYDGFTCFYNADLPVFPGSLSQRGSRISEQPWLPSKICCADFDERPQWALFHQVIFLDRITFFSPTDLDIFMSFCTYFPTRNHNNVCLSDKK
jgi:hypothetical protein